ncbi:MAG: hypothetical protein H7066_14165 [Cytophagaceae bacterium]|nr:hypothetical protein [Gemmatimonadaceae bacterium]
MAKDKGTKPDGANQQGSGEPEENDTNTEDRGQFAGGNRNVKDDKSQGSDADRGQRGSQGGNKRGGSKG